MDLSFSPAEIEYRDRARAWIRAHKPSWWQSREGDGVRQRRCDLRRHPPLAPGAVRRRLRRSHLAGGVRRTGPVARRERAPAGRARDRERAAHHERSGIGLCGPAIVHHGSEAQKKRFLRPMLRAEEMWCQGYSEPDAGSDLANLRTMRGCCAAISTS